MMYTIRPEDRCFNGVASFMPPWKASGLIISSRVRGGADDSVGIVIEIVIVIGIGIATGATFLVGS